MKVPVLIFNSKSETMHKLKHKENKVYSRLSEWKILDKFTSLCFAGVLKLFTVYQWMVRSGDHLVCGWTESQIRSLHGNRNLTGCLAGGEGDLSVHSMQIALNWKEIQGLSTVS